MESVWGKFINFLSLSSFHTRIIQTFLLSNLVDLEKQNLKFFGLHLYWCLVQSHAEI